MAEFHSAFEAPILKSPAIPEDSRCDLRVNLLQEELNEFKEAIANKNLREVLDALADLQYVLSGAVLEFGMADIFEAANTKVHNSNMSKLCTPDQAERTKQKYEQQHGENSCYIKESVNGKYIVLRKSDNKVIKNIEYTPVDLSEFVK